ncbi:MAG: hypothetical protein NVSMB9_23840 [Isosphaeraceae bacterium]
MPRPAPLLTPSEGTSPTPPVPTEPERSVLTPARSSPKRVGRVSSLRKWFILTLMLLGLFALTIWNGMRNSLLDEARAAERRGDFVTGSRCALDHLDHWLWSGEANLVAARCLSRLDFAELAEPHYRKAGALTLEDLHYRAYGFVRANFREKAIQAYEEILARYPGDVSSLKLEGGVLLSQSRWNEVREVARRLMEIPPGPVSVYTPVVAVGHWTLKLRQVESASVIGYTLEGTVHQNLHDPEPAAAAFDRVLALDPELRSMPLQRSLFWSHLAEDLLRIGRADDVIRHLTKAPETRSDPGLIVQLGQAYVLRSSFDEADVCFRQALDLDPKFYAAWLGLGRLALQRHQPEEAVSSLQQAAKLSPGSYETTYGLSLAYRQLGKDEEARRYQKKADQLRSRVRREPGGMGAIPGKPSP